MRGAVKAMRNADPVASEFGPQVECRDSAGKVWFSGPFRTSIEDRAPTGAQNNHADPIYDLAGNVWEWANDWRECSLGTDPVVDPSGPISG